MSYEVGRGKPPKHTQFRPGQSGNVEGARRHNQELKAVKRLVSTEVQELATLLLRGNMAEVKAALGDNEASALKVMLASIIDRGFRRGDMRTLDSLLNRLIGRPSANVIVSSDEVSPVRVMVEAMTREERKAELARLRGRAAPFGDD
ncbi:DUF5681 domain-containing protein [Bdellovibrionota bacterium FG-2]